MAADALLPALLASGATPGLAKLASLARKRLHPDHDPSFVPSVAEAQELLALGEELLHAVVALERAKGTSWEAIGRELGITRSTAHGRFSTGRPEGGEVSELRREVDDKWSKARDLAERATRPVTNSVARLDPGYRNALASTLNDLAHDHDLADPARLQAAQLVFAIEPEAGERALRKLTESYLREPLAPESEDPQTRVADGPVYRRFMEQLSREDRPEVVDEAGLDFLVDSYRTVVERTPDHSEISNRARRKLAWARRLRFTVRGRPEDLDEAITLLRDLVNQSGDTRDFVEALIARSAVLLDRFGITRDLRDLEDAREILTYQVPPGFRSVDPQSVADLATALLRLAAALASIDKWRDSERILHETLASLDEVPGSREKTTGLVVRARLQLACVHAELGEFETSRFDALRAAEEAEAGLARNHPLTILARQVHITVLAERGHRDEDLLAIMRSLDKLSREFQAR